MKPLKAGISEQRTISAQDLSDSQVGAGFGKGFSKATPPVSKNRHSWSSSSPLKYVGTYMYTPLMFTTWKGIKTILTFF